jgi:hypothetical protein
MTKRDRLYHTGILGLLLFNNNITEAHKTDYNYNQLQKMRTRGVFDKITVLSIFSHHQTVYTKGSLG